MTVTTQGRAPRLRRPAGATVGNPTGAGDAFAGGYLAAWLRSAEEADCVAAGAAAARRRMEATPMTAWYLQGRRQPGGGRPRRRPGPGPLAADMLDDATLLNEDRGLTTVVGSWDGAEVIVAPSGWAPRSPPW